MTTVAENKSVVKTCTTIRTSPNSVKTSPCRKGTRGRSVQAAISPPQFSRKYPTPYSSRYLACMKYRAASIMTSGAPQKSAAAANDATKSVAGRQWPRTETLEIAKAKAIPIARIGVTVTISSRSKAHRQLVSLLSSKERRTKRPAKTVRVAREISTAKRPWLESSGRGLSALGMPCFPGLPGRWVGGAGLPNTAGLVRVEPRTGHHETTFSQEKIRSMTVS